ncbi:MAG: hypothetical protein V1822_03705 [Candidatus Micrarchaeota archaeon]
MEGKNEMQKTLCAPSVQPSPSHASRVFFLAALAIIFFSQAAFAANEWQPAVSGAILVAVFLLSIAYMVVHIMHLESFRPLLYDEAGQIVLTAAIIAVLILAAPNLDDIIKKGVYGVSLSDQYCSSLNPSAPSKTYCNSLKSNAQIPDEDIRDWALKINGANTAFLSQRIVKTVEFINRVGEQSAQSGMCNMLGVGFTIAGCQSWSILRTPAGQLLSAEGFAQMDLQAENILLTAAKTIALPLLLPLGVLLRCIYFTRQAGSVLIALAVSLYFLFPALIVAGQAAADAYLATHDEYARNYDPGTGNYVCDPFDPDAGDLKAQMYDIIAAHPPDSSSLDERVLFLVLGRYMLMTVLALTAALAAVTGIGHILGTEINVMSIARLS